MENALAPLLHAITPVMARHPARIAAEQVVANIAKSLTRMIEAPASSTPVSDSVIAGYLAGDKSEFSSALAQTNHLVAWHSPLTEKIPETMTRQMAYCELIGPQGMIANDDCRMGLYAQGPNTAYDWHSHAAEELYIAMYGTAGWQTEHTEERDLPPIAHIHHPSWCSHATRTREDPLLAIWAWVGDLSFDTYRMDI